MNNILSCICLIVLNSATVFAEEIKLPGAMLELDTKQKLFVEEYVKAVNSDNPDKLKSLIHPKSLSCITEENKEFFDDQFSDQLKKDIPLDRDVYVKEVNPDDKLPFTGYFSYPAHPTHLIQINYEVRKNEGMSLMIFVVNQNNQYSKVLPCPKPEFMKKYREEKIQKENRKIRSKELILKLKDPLLSELKKLLSQGNEIQAIKKYSAETGESLATAKDVVNLLKIEDGHLTKGSSGSLRDR